MNERQDNQAFERRTRALFDDSTADLNAATRSRLTQARHVALDAARAKSHWTSKWTWGLPSGAAAMLAVTLMLNRPASDVPLPAALDDLQIIASENLELLENVEFYAWLDEQPTPADEAG